jgi:hypothetical protein
MQRENSLLEIKAYQPASIHLFYWLSYNGPDKSILYKGKVVPVLNKLSTTP